MKKERLVRLLENTAAISAELHTEEKRFRQFYDNNGASMGGFPGIWKYCVEMAEEFTAADEKHKSEDCWIDAIFSYVERVMEADEVPTNKELYALAVKAIKSVNKGVLA